MKYKKCSKCEKKKPINEFVVNKRSKGGIENECKVCKKTYNHNYYLNHKEEINIRTKVYNRANPEVVQKGVKNQKENHPTYHKDYQREYQRKRIKEDVSFKLNHNMRCAILYSLKNGKDGNSWETLVGYTLKDLMVHLEKQFQPGMTWENYGRGEGKWHIDHHPIQLYWFVFTSYKDKGFKKAWALENLRPMWSRLNQSKGNKLFHS